MNREELKQSILSSFEEKLHDLRTSYEAYQQQALDAPGAMQSHHDPFRREAGLLIHDVMRRIATFQSAYAYLAANEFASEAFVGAGTAAYVERDGVLQVYIFLPEGAGEEGRCDQTPWVIVSTTSPLFIEFKDKAAGAEIEFRGKHYKVVSFL